MRKLYAYSTKTYYHDFLESDKIPYIKIGDTEREVIDRVREQDTTSTPEKLLILKEWDIEKHRDHEVHKFLEKAGFFRVRDEREWFQCNITDIDSAVNKLLRGVSRPENFKMRAEQKLGHDRAIAFYKNGGEDYLFNAKMRYGKTHTAYQVMKSLCAKRTLILTYKPAISDSWEEDLITHVDFVGYTFYHALRFDKDNPIRFNGGKVVLFASFQDILGKDLNGRIKNKWKCIFNTKWDLLIVDEVHFGAETERARKLLDSLNFKRRLSLSGTPLEILMSGLYTDDQVFTWSYLDEQGKRNLEKRGGWKTEIYRWLPVMNLYAYSLTREVEELGTLYDTNEGPTLNKFFYSDDGEKLKNEADVDRWLNNLAEKSTRKFNSPFNRNEFAGKLNHLFWYLSGVNHCKALAKKLRSHYYFKQYKIVVAADDNEGEGKDTLNLVRKAIARNPKTITLSCGKLNTGVTIPEWTGVFMLSDMVSAETYWQTAFRAQSPNRKDRKEKCFIFDFNPNRALKMYYTYAEEIAKNNETTTSTIRSLLDLMPVFSYENNELVKLKDIGKIVDCGIKVESTVTKFASERIVHPENVNKEILELLKDIKGTKGKKIDVALIKSFLKNGKTFKSQGRKLTPKEKNLLEGLRAQAITVTKNIPRFVYVSKGIESVKDILKSREKVLFTDAVGISLEDFGLMVNSKFLDERILDRAIQAFNLV